MFARRLCWFLVWLVTFQAGQVHGQTIFDLDPNTPSRFRPGNQLSDTILYQDFVGEILEFEAAGDALDWDTVLFHADVQDRFSFDTDLIATTDPRRFVKVFNNLVVEGQNQSTDTLTLFSQVLPGNPPINRFNLFLSSITVRNALLTETDPAPGNPLIRGLNIASVGVLNLDNGKVEFNNGAFVFNPTGGTINVLNGNNSLELPNFQATALDIDIRPSTVLSIVNGTHLMAPTGTLMMGPGSVLNVENSAVTLLQGNVLVDGATINLNGPFGGGGFAHLQFFNPTFNNATLNLGPNTHLRSFLPGVSPSDGQILFTGNTTLSLDDGAFISASQDNMNLDRGTLIFRNGTVLVRSTAGASPINAPALRAAKWTLDQVDFTLNGVVGTDALQLLDVVNNSVMRHSDATYSSLTSLKIHDSTIHSRRTRYETQFADIRNAQFNMDFGGNELGALEIVGSIPTAVANFSGTNTVQTRLLPGGQPIVVGLPAMRYNDLVQLDNIRANGFNTLNFELQAATPGLSATDYTTGGENSDGEYRLALLTGGATADSDTPAFTLGASLPALLRVQQDEKPSTDNAVSIRLSADFNNLLTHPGATNSNTSSAANLLVSAANQGSTSHQNALNLLTNGQVNSHLTSLHPEAYSSFLTIGLEHSELVAGAVLDHSARNGMFALAPAKLGRDVDHRKRVWTNGIYVQGEVDGRNGLGSFDYSLQSTVIGSDLFLTESVVCGTFFGFGSQSMDEHDLAVQTIRGDTYDAGVYLDVQTTSFWRISFVGGYGYGDINSTRVVVLANQTHRPTANFDRHAAYVGIRNTFDWINHPLLTLAPVIGLNYFYNSLSTFTESGNPNFALHVDGADAHAIVSTVGLNARFRPLAEESTVAPIAYFRYERDWYAANMSEHTITASLASNPDFHQNFSGQNRGADVYVGGVGLEGIVLQTVYISGGYLYTHSVHGWESGGFVRGEVRW